VVSRYASDIRRCTPRSEARIAMPNSSATSRSGRSASLDRRVSCPAAELLVAATRSDPRPVRPRRQQSSFLGLDFGYPPPRIHHIGDQPVQRRPRRIEHAADVGHVFRCALTCIPSLRTGRSAEPASGSGDTRGFSPSIIEQRFEYCNGHFAHVVIRDGVRCMMGGGRGRFVVVLPPCRIGQRDRRRSRHLVAELLRGHDRQGRVSSSERAKRRDS
jgi:hypothetical protein